MENKHLSAYGNMSEEEYLSSYNIHNYPSYAVTADAVIFSLRKVSSDNYRKESSAKLSVLLVERRAHPYRGRFALPGGFMREDESLEECAVREIEEETGIRVFRLIPSGVFSAKGRDPRGRIVSNAFIALVPEDEAKLHSGADAARAVWFDIAVKESDNTLDLTLSGDNKEIVISLRAEPGIDGNLHYREVSEKVLSFDHAEIIASAISTLKRSASEPEELLQLVSEPFTLNELQQTYELLLGRAEQAPNFRRKISPYVTETDEYISGQGHRPARLYVKRKG